MKTSLQNIVSGILLIMVIISVVAYITKPTFKSEYELLKEELVQKQQTYEQELNEIHYLRINDKKEFQERLQQKEAEHAAQLLKIQNDDKAKDHYFSSDYDERFNVFSETYNPKD